LARARNKAPDSISYPHPLSWWRLRRADEFTKADIGIARHILKKTAVIGEPHWFLGAAGDIAVAMNVAHRALKRDGHILLDVAMTAVLCIALEGNVAAALFLSATLKRQPEHDPSRTLADSWLTYEPARVNDVAMQASRGE
jgi:hypothetical protein